MPGGPAAVRVRGSAKDVDIASADLHHEEPTPRCVGVPRRRGWYPQSLEYTTDGRRGYPVAELERLTLDTAVTPSGVLLCHALDQRHDGVVDLWAPGSVRVGLGSKPLTWFEGEQSALVPALRDQVDVAG